MSLEPKQILAGKALDLLISKETNFRRTSMAIKRAVELASKIKQAAVNKDADVVDPDLVSQGILVKMNPGMENSKHQNRCYAYFFVKGSEEIKNTCFMDLGYALFPLGCFSSIECIEPTPNSLPSSSQQQQRLLLEKEKGHTFFCNLFGLEIHMFLLYHFINDGSLPTNINAVYSPGGNRGDLERRYPRIHQIITETISLIEDPDDDDFENLKKDSYVWEASAATKAKLSGSKIPHRIFKDVGPPQWFTESRYPEENPMSRLKKFLTLGLSVQKNKVAYEAVMIGEQECKRTRDLVHLITNHKFNISWEDVGYKSKGLQQSFLRVTSDLWYDLSVPIRSPISWYPELAHRISKYVTSPIPKTLTFSSDSSTATKTKTPPAPMKRRFSRTDLGSDEFGEDTKEIPKTPTQNPQNSFTKRGGVLKRLKFPADPKNDDVWVADSDNEEDHALGSPASFFSPEAIVPFTDSTPLTLKRSSSPYLFDDDDEVGPIQTPPSSPKSQPYHSSGIKNPFETLDSQAENKPQTQQQQQPAQAQSFKTQQPYSPESSDSSQSSNPFTERTRTKRSDDDLVRRYQDEPLLQREELNECDVLSCSSDSDSEVDSD